MDLEEVNTVCGKPYGERCIDCVYDMCTEWGYHNEEEQE